MFPAGINNVKLPVVLKKTLPPPVLFIENSFICKFESAPEFPLTLLAVEPENSNLSIIKLFPPDNTRLPSSNNLAPVGDEIVVGNVDVVIDDFITVSLDRTIMPEPCASKPKK